MDTREIWDRLGKIALKDGNLSADENKILMEVLSDVDKYRITLNKAIFDGIMDETEQDRLEHLRSTILDKMHNIAKDDGKITKEENELIAETVKIMNELDDESKTHLN